MKIISEFLNIDVPEECWDNVVNRCTFSQVKKDPGKVVGADLDLQFKGGGDTFIHKGTNGRWVGVLDDEDLALYDEAMAHLPEDYASWLENGGPTQVQP